MSDVNRADVRHGRLCWHRVGLLLEWDGQRRADRSRRAGAWSGGHGRARSQRRAIHGVFWITHDLAGTMQLDRSCLLDLLSQELRPSLVTGLELARASLTPRLAQASASQSLPSQLNLKTAVGAGISHPPVEPKARPVP